MSSKVWKGCKGVRTR